MTLKKGVRGQLRIIIDDRNGNHVPDVTVEVEGNIPGFDPFTLSTPPKDVPAELARQYMREGAEKLSGKPREFLLGAAEAVAFMTGTGQRGACRVSFGDQDGDGHLDVQGELEGYLMGFKLPVLDSGVQNVPIAQALEMASTAASVLPQPGAGIAVTAIEGVRFITRFLPV